MTRPKPRRRNAILRLIASGSIRTHEQLSAALDAEGIHVSQTTLSRDLRDLGVVKAAEGYHLLDRASPAMLGERALARVVADFVVDSRTAQNLVVLRTPPGGANAVAQCLDDAGWSDIVGTIAGDDTIFVATPDPPTARQVRERLERL